MIQSSTRVRVIRVRFLSQAVMSTSTGTAENLTTVDQLKEKLIGAYREKFGDDQPTIAAFAPGRVNLIGEHLDYNDGFVFPMGISVGTMVVGNAIEDPICYFQTLSG